MSTAGRRVRRPHGWIQWKGTNVCMDVHCRCGASLHLDATFAYHIQCPHCEQVYECDGHIRLVPVARAPANMPAAIRLDPDEDRDRALWERELEAKGRMLPLPVREA